MKTDAEIFEEMRNRQLNEYLEKQATYADNYDKCFAEIDKEASELLKSLLDMIKKYSDRYNIDEYQIMEDMIIPTIKSEIA